MQDAVRPGTHAVDGPLGVAMLVADGDAEAAVVGPDEVDHVTRVALHVEGGALARVRRPVARPLECWRTVSLYGGRKAGDDDDHGQEEQQRASRRGVGGGRGDGGGTGGGGGNTGGHKGGVAPPPWHTAPRHGYGGPVLTTMPHC